MRGFLLTFVLSAAAISTFAQPSGCIVDTIAGGGTNETDMAGPALEAALGLPGGIAAAADGTVYFVDRQDWRVLKVRVDGLIEPVGGTGQIGRPVDGVPATESPITEPVDVALGPDGSLYVATRVTSQLLRIDNEGLIEVVAGTETCSASS